MDRDSVPKFLYDVEVQTNDVLSKLVVDLMASHSRRDRLLEDLSETVHQRRLHKVEIEKARKQAADKSQQKSDHPINQVSNQGTRSQHSAKNQSHATTHHFTTPATEDQQPTSSGSYRQNREPVATRNDQELVGDLKSDFPQFHEPRPPPRSQMAPPRKESHGRSATQINQSSTTRREGPSTLASSTQSTSGTQEKRRFSLRDIHMPPPSSSSQTRPMLDLPGMGLSAYMRTRAEPQPRTEPNIPGARQRNFKRRGPRYWPFT